LTATVSRSFFVSWHKAGYDEGMNEGEEAHLEGFLSVQAALMARSREIFEIFLRRDKQDGQTRRLERLASEQNIPTQRVSAEDIEAQAGGKTHGGVLARVGLRRFVTLETLLPPGEDGWVVMLDGVEDPFNFGAAVRSLHAAGADGLIVRPRNWMSAAAVVARASAGASELIPTAIAETAQDAAEFFQGQNVLVACATDTPPSISLYDAELTGRLFLLIGGEKRGVTRSFEAAADLRLRIPYARREAYSLGTAAAAAVLGFEIFRQRTQQKT
jgi:23S rRNA (guanosine2251-2'-O)-methyltransferase